MAAGSEEAEGSGTVCCLGIAWWFGIVGIRPSFLLLPMPCLPGRAGKGREGPGRAGKGLPPPRPGGSGAFRFRGFTEGEAERGQGSWVDASGLVFEARAR